ncbi:MAG: hypothetical protein HON94_13530 [Methylococcales bacterium]|jgi:transketolase|nr:hypothetical protein [Methylococcales bacterium]MBT7408478.1 hypothetical protein [Methylococcales bacterium]
MTQLEFWQTGEKVSIREGFGRVLNYAATQRDDFVLFDADVAGGTGAKPFVQENPQRVIQFGIAEQNMMAAAAGFSDCGIIPVVSTFASFGVMRAHEQFRTAICYANRNVKLCCSHIGLDTGPDGATAQMLEDLATMRAIPNVTVISPADANEFMQAFLAMLDHTGPVYLRIGRSDNPIIADGKSDFKIGKAQRLTEGNDITIIATGVMVERALNVAEQLKNNEKISARVINLSTIKPLDQTEILLAAQQTNGIVTAEDHNVCGGMGSAVAEFLAENHPTKMKRVGVNDQFGKSGEPDELAKFFHIDEASIYQACLSI